MSWMWSFEVDLLAVIGLRRLRGGGLMRRVWIYDDIVVMILLIFEEHLLAGFHA
jgi:hypothetical protein